MALTDVAIRGLKPSDKPFKVADGGGLFILVQPNGAKLWRLAYRYGGKQKALALGAYPDVGLREARDGREDAKRRLRAGEDPNVAKKEAKRKQVASELTFRDLAERWFEARKGGWVESYSGRIWSRVEDDIISQIGRKPIDRVTADDVLTALRKVEERGAVEMAHRIKNYVVDIFRYAKAERLCDDNPAADLNHALKTPMPPRRRAALPKLQLPNFMDALERYDGDKLTRLALKLVMHTFVRTSELRFAKRPEFEGLDGKEPLWRIPPERMKMRNPHVVPLSPQAVVIVKELLKLHGKRDGFMFPAATNTGVISENTMLYAMYRMGFHGRATVHGFRGMASTILNEAGFNRDWIERQLAHVDQDQVRAAYNAAEWLPERRKMMEWWSDYLDRQATVGELVG